MSLLFRELELVESCWLTKELELGDPRVGCCCRSWCCSWDKELWASCWSVKELELGASWACRWASLLMILLLKDPVGRFAWFSEENFERNRTLDRSYDDCYTNYLTTQMGLGAIFSLCRSIKNLSLVENHLPCPPNVFVPNSCQNFLFPFEGWNQYPMDRKLFSAAYNLLRCIHPENDPFCKGQPSW